MKDKDPNDYFIPITPEFLFDTYGVFKSEYAPWVYLVLKFKYKYYIQKCPNKRFHIPTTGISNLFGVNPSTITRALQELVHEGFLARYKKLYTIKDESFYKDKYKPKTIEVDNLENEPLNSYVEFVKVYKVQFENMFNSFKDRVPDKYKSKFLIKLFETYYYLIAKNRHTAFKKENKKKMVASYECPRSIYKTLNYDNRTLNDILAVLEGVGLIKLGTDIKITTIDIRFKETQDNSVNTNTYEYKKTDFRKADSDVNYSRLSINNHINDESVEEKSPTEEEFNYALKNEYDPINGGFKKVQVEVKGKQPVFEKRVERIISEDELNKGKALLEKYKREKAEAEAKRLKPLQDEFDQYKKDHPGEQIIALNTPRLTKPEWLIDRDDSYDEADENNKDEETEDIYSEELLQLEEY
jgi:DNA-binding transcriptional regulator YhcF (GntR family)